MFGYYPFVLAAVVIDSLHWSFHWIKNAATGCNRQTVSYNYIHIDYKHTPPTFSQKHSVLYPCDVRVKREQWTMGNALRYKGNKAYCNIYVHFDKS